MAKKRKKQVFDVVAVVKSASRIHIGQVPTTKVVPHKNDLTGRKAKYPKNLLKEDGE